MYRVFEIGDLTDTVNLLAPKSGFHLARWRPKIAGLKGGGVWQDSQLAHGRTLVMGKLENVTEEVELVVNGQSPSAVITDTQRMRRLLKRARDYWTAYSQPPYTAPGPVWMKVQADGEALPRYYVIKHAWAPEDENPFYPPFVSFEEIMAMGDFMLYVEREPLGRAEQPGSTTAVELSAVETYNSLDFGNVDDSGDRDPTTANEVFFAAERTMANLTHVYVDDGGVFGANLVNAAVPFNLLPAVPAVNDAVYFGCQSAIANSGPFHSLVFDIGTAGTNYTITWEMWDGAWTAMTEPPVLACDLQDNTADFTNTGVQSVHWFPLTGWTTTAVNGVTAYWIRARVSASPGGATAPAQRNRKVYAVTWPYVEIQDDQILGDWPALARLKFYNHSCLDSDREPQLYTDRIMIGARGVDRGEDFTAYLNLSDEQNPSGITVSAVNTAAFVNDVAQAPTGRAVQWTPGAAAAMQDRVQVELDSSIASHFYGRFHAFVRIECAGAAAGDFRIQLRAICNGSTGNLYYQSEPAINDVAGNLIPQPIDLGEFTLPPGGAKPGEVLDSIYFNVMAECTDAGGGDITFYDLILMPIDEWAGTVEEVASLADTHILDASNYLDFDSCTYPKEPLYSPVRDISTDNLQLTYRARSPEPAQILSGQRTRLWFLVAALRTVGDDAKVSEPFQGLSVQLEAVQRYEGMRGDNL